RENRPLPPICESGRSVTRSPVVEITSTAISASATPWATASRCRTSCACSRARAEPRVPRRMKGADCKCISSYCRPTASDGDGLDRSMGPGKRVRILGIETSCDETAAAIVTRDGAGPGRILANVVRSQVAEHAAYGGVVPELAARSHVTHLDGIIRRAVAEAGVPLRDLDGIAATAGPGLIGGVLVGLTTAKALAAALGKPLLAVNHLEAHALTARLTDGVAFPYLMLLVSGGHSQFVLVRGVGDYRLWGTTIDDA